MLVSVFLPFYLRRFSGSNLFNYYDGMKTCREPPKQYCVCKGDSLTGYKENCNITSLLTGGRDYYQTIGGSLLIHPTAISCNSKVAGLVLPQEKSHCPNSYPTPLSPPTRPPSRWPTRTGKTERGVKVYCEKEIIESAVGRACASIPNFPFQDSINECILNVKVSEVHLFKVLFLKP